MRNGETQPNNERLYDLSALLLRAGNAVSVLLLTAGMVLTLWYKSRADIHSHSLLNAWHRLLRADPSGFLEVGLQMIILTPVIASLAIGVYALAHRQRSLLIPSLLVIGGLALSLWIGIAW
ncbi:MAG: DUF1634 domain-containing protein [Chthonomonadetes bacterium]|nr:DUF1634 domain-containing protein [Chthonomonadetes bacterium]